VPEPVKRPARIDPAQSVELAIPSAARVFRRVYNDYFAQIGLSPTQALLVGVLDHYREPMQQTVLADRIGIRKAMIGHAIDVLLAAGYVTRVSDPGDGRAKLVSLTARGRELASTVDQRFGELAAVIRRRTTRAQRVAMVELLTLMTENLEEFAASDFS